MLDNLSLDGKTIVITGAGTGLGKEMAIALGRAGADLVIASRRQGPIDQVAELIREMGRMSIAVSTDVTDSSQVDHLFRLALDKFGKIDVLVNNAGIVRGREATPIWEVTDDEWRLGIDTNLTGSFFCSRAIAKHMVERQEGKIVNVSSGFGLRGGRDNYMYTCGKGGVVQLTRSLAVSLGGYGITSNCIVPGYVPVGDKFTDPPLPNDFIPIGRVGMPSELGPVAVFLASSASNYMNGEMFIIDGGGLAGGYAPTGHSPEIPLII